ncbi:hypothetical protein KJ570_02495 [Patescibacteria group bacterium]|nr:hypothetical protein [Patescibacteria group bacterium]MBU2035907.1 hypothetical protein [Patescibacteria group bacterium]
MKEKISIIAIVVNVLLTISKVSVGKEKENLRAKFREQLEKNQASIVFA